MLAKIKALLGIADATKDSLLQVLIDQATDQVLTYTHNPASICKLTSTIVEMVVFMYNKLGTEGLNSESYSGVSFSYLTDYPDSIMRAIKAYRKLRTC